MQFNLARISNSGFSVGKKMGGGLKNNLFAKLAVHKISLGTRDLYIANKLNDKKAVCKFSFRR